MVTFEIILRVLFSVLLLPHRLTKRFPHVLIHVCISCTIKAFIMFVQCTCTVCNFLPVFVSSLLHTQVLDAAHLEIFVDYNLWL